MSGAAPLWDADASYERVAFEDLASRSVRHTDGPTRRSGPAIDGGTRAS
jgi:hypothetical protein